MKPIYLSGFNVSLNVDRARLNIHDGHQGPDDAPEQYMIQPRNPSFDSVIVDTQSGSISFTAIKWLMRHNIPLFILDYNGTILSSTLPREPAVGNLKKAQLETHLDSSKRRYIAEKILQAKFQRTLEIIDWLSSRYIIPSNFRKSIQSEIRRINDNVTIEGLLRIEAKVAEKYWQILYHIIPEKYCFNSRVRSKHQNNASDQINVLLNYGYSILESQCRKAINTVGLESTIGFLHETRQTKYPLAYDLQEPFRWIIDTTVISCIEEKRFNQKDFFRMDNYVLRLKPEAVKKYLEIIREKFNSSIICSGKSYHWDTIIQLKTQELTKYILGKTKKIDFSNPGPHLINVDEKHLRDSILSLSTGEARKRGIRKNTLWHLKKRVKEKKSLKIYSKVSEKLLRVT